jgi:hypothetical protein
VGERSDWQNNGRDLGRESKELPFCASLAKTVLFEQRDVAEASSWEIVWLKELAEELVAEDPGACLPLP